MTQEQWEAIQGCDRQYDGRFYYGLTSTKTVCRPSCHKHGCNPKHVVIFDTLDQALKAGYRPCLRCCPEHDGWEGAKKELGKKAAKWMESHYAERFSLDAMAAEMHVDKNYLLRAFKEATGYTPLQYHNLLRCRQAETLLRRKSYNIAFIAEEVGFKTPSHFTQVYKKTMGRTPSEYREEHMN